MNRFLHTFSNLVGTVKLQSHNQDRCATAVTLTNSVCLLISLLLLPVMANAQSAPAAQIKDLYQQKCAQCHGWDGQGVVGGDVPPIEIHQSVKDLSMYIADTMPEGNPEHCVGEEATALAKYLHQQLKGKNLAEVPTLSRLTVEQYRNAVADVVGRFPIRTPLDDSHTAPIGSDPRSDLRLESRLRGYLPAPPTGLQSPGLGGMYYQSRGSSKADRLAFFRSDTRMKFDFGSASPAETISDDQFAITWTGSFAADQTGYYRFRLRTHNGARLYVNSDPIRQRPSLREPSQSQSQKELIDAWVGSGSLQEKTGRVYLLGGRRYRIRMEFFKFFEDQASVSLEWKPPHGTWSVLDYNHTNSHRPDRVFVATTNFPADDQSLGYARGNSVSPQWQEATMNGAIEAANEVVDRLGYLAALPAVNTEGFSDGDDKKKSEADVAAEKAERLERVHTFLLKFASVAFGRPLTEVEQEVILGLAPTDPDNLDDGVRRSVIVTLMSPHFLYPDLTAENESPSPFTVASRLSFGLWDSIPDAELIDAAVNGQLETAEQLQSQARRMLRDRRAKAKLRRFFSDWLEVEYRDLSKDKELFPNFDESVIADLRRSLQLFIDRVVWSRDSDYRQLLQADYLMLNKPLAELYSIDPTQQPQKGDRNKRELTRIANRRQFASEFQPVDFPKNQRSGILTHPYLLSAYAYHNNTSPIHRGVFLTRNIVGRALSPPPDAVAFKDDEFSPELTMREKITQLTRDTACMSCHSVINPLGFTLENFDAVGRWREIDNKKPVNTSSVYTTQSGEKVTVNNAQDIAKIAVESESAHKAFIGHLFEHVVRRSPRDVDSELLTKLHARFQKDKFHVLKLWTRIAVLSAAQNFTDTSAVLKIEESK